MKVFRCHAPAVGTRTDNGNRLTLQISYGEFNVYRVAAGNSAEVHLNWRDQKSFTGYILLKVTIRSEPNGSDSKRDETSYDC